MRNLRYDTSETYRQSRKTHRGQSCGYGGEVEEGMDWVREEEAAAAAAAAAAGGVELYLLLPLHSLPTFFP